MVPVQLQQVRSLPALRNQYRVLLWLWQIPPVPLWQAWSENSEHNSVLRQEKRLEMKILFKVDIYARPTKLLRESFIQRVKAALLGSFRNILSCGNFSPVCPSSLPFLSKNLYSRPSFRNHTGPLGHLHYNAWFSMYVYHKLCFIRRKLFPVKMEVLHFDS